jgi:hypothetical protein
MKHYQHVMLILLAVVCTAAPLTAQTGEGASGPALPGGESARRGYVGADLGYRTGLGGELHLSLLNLAPNLPLGVHTQFGLYYVFDPGDAAKAHEAFQGNETGATLDSKKGRNMVAALDLSYRFLRTEGFELSALVGPRYDHFQGTYTFPNEAFDVTSHTWGVGAGGMLELFSAPRVRVRLFAGADYYFRTKLSGHGSSYTPDGVDDDPAEGFDYEDADKAVRQPRFVPRVAIGVHFLVLHAPWGSR